MSTTTRALLIGLTALLLATSAQAGEYGWVPPPPPPPTPPLAGQTVAPTMAERRAGGFIHLAWTKSVQTAYLSMLTAHVIAEANGRDASKLQFPETPLMGGHAAVFVTSPWGYALAIDDGRPHRRHLGLAIGLYEAAVYSAGVGALSLLTRRLYRANDCHVPDPEARWCIDNPHLATTRPQSVIMLTTTPFLLAFAVLHTAATARLRVLEKAGVMDGPAGDAYRAVYELPKPRAMVLPTANGVAIVGIF